jgi:hypothetical protein
VGREHGQAEQVEAGRAGLEEGELEDGAAVLAAKLEDGGAGEDVEDAVGLDEAERAVAVGEAGDGAGGGVGEGGVGVDEEGRGEHVGVAAAAGARGEHDGRRDVGQLGDEHVAGVLRLDGDAVEQATGAEQLDLGGLGVVGGGGGVHAGADLGGVAELGEDRGGDAVLVGDLLAGGGGEQRLEVGGGHGRDVDGLDDPRARGRLGRAAGVEVEVDGGGEVGVVDRDVAAGEQAQGGDLVGHRQDELGLEGPGDRPGDGEGVAVGGEGAAGDDDLFGGVQPGADLLDAGQVRAVPHADVEEVGFGGLAAGEGVGVGADAQPHLGHAVVADDAGVVGGLVEGVEVDDAADLRAVDEALLELLDDDAAGHEFEAGLGGARLDAEDAVEVALVEHEGAGVAGEAGDLAGRVAEQRLAVEDDRDRGEAAAALDDAALAAGGAHALGADEGAGQGVVGAADVEAVGAGVQLEAGGAGAGAVAGLDDDAARRAREHGVDAVGEVAERADVGAVLGGEQVVEQAGQGGLGQAAADVREGQAALVLVDVDPHGAVADRGLDQLEDVGGAVGEGELTELLDRLGAGDREALALAEAAGAAGLGDDGVDRHQRRPP